MGRGIIEVSLAFSILIVNCCNPGITQINRTNNISNSYEPYLRMPFKAGVIVLCAQVNLSPHGFSHSIDRLNCLFLLDFLNPTIPGLEIVAA